MKVVILIYAIVSFTALAVEGKKKGYYQKENMDYGDKQLLRRDLCRKPIEALETKYDHIKKEDLEKMKKECGD